MPSAARKPLLESVLSLPVTFAVAIGVFVLIVVPRAVNDPDIWWHLRNAQILVQTHRFITQDTFSFTALHAPWMNHEWLGELPFYAGWHLAQGVGVYRTTVLAIELVTLGTFLLAWRRSRSAVGAVVVTIFGMFLSSISYGPRTVLFGYVCMVLLLLVLEESRKRPQLVWLLPPLFALWVNTHGSWLIGMVLLIAYIATASFPFDWGAITSKGLPPAERRNLVVAAVLSFFALFLNPYGWRLVAYPFNLAFHQTLNIANVEEWKQLDLSSPRGKLMLIALVALAVWQLYGRRRWELRDLAFVAIGLYSAVMHSRFLVLFSIIAAPALAAKFPPSERTADYKPKPFLNGIVIFALLIAGINQLRQRPDVSSAKAMALYPVDALPMLQSLHPQGNVFHEYLWGGYLIWNVRDIPTFVDSRVDIFEYNGTFKDYLDIVHLQKPIELLDQHHIRYVLFEKDTPLIYLLERTGGWKLVYDNGNTILLERSPGAPAIIPAH